MAQSDVHSRLTEEERAKANKFFMRSLQGTLVEGKRNLRRLHLKLTITYFIIIVLSIVMFALGVLLLSVPIKAGLSGDESAPGIWNSIIAGGFGLSDLVALFLFRPIERVHSIMGDISQLTLALNSYQTQVSLRLLECNSDKPETLGIAAEKINDAAVSSIKLVQDYFETKAQENT